MKTLGIDLAAQAKKTAVCVIDWLDDTVVVNAPVSGLNDDELIEKMKAADWIGIDAPFGWPVRVVEAQRDFDERGVWPEDATSDVLRYRTTDHYVSGHASRAEGVRVWPLSVSSDRIAVCAWRCARLLSRYSRETSWSLDRVGLPSSSAPEQGIAEVYPAAALARWGAHHKGYKSSTAATAAAGRKQREKVMKGLCKSAGSWLQLDAVREDCLASDDAFDAFLAALVARAAARGLTDHPGADDRLVVEREGWIHLPTTTSLADLHR